MRDDLFKKNINSPFAFDQKVAAVFDDMAERSIPFYHITLRLISHLSFEFLSQHLRVYDLGSATGNVLIQIALRANESNINNINLIGVDNSEAMIKHSRLKAQALGVNICFEYADIVNYDFLDSDVCISHYTLQFIPPQKRLYVLEKIFTSLRIGGALILSEKICFKDDFLQEQTTKYYYKYKESQGYSLTEIAQKRKALEDVLIAYTSSQNIALLQNVGFSCIEPLFQWLNFQTIIAIK